MPRLEVWFAPPLTGDHDPRNSPVHSHTASGTQLYGTNLQHPTPKEAESHSPALTPHLQSRSEISLTLPTIPHPNQSYILLPTFTSLTTPISPNRLTNPINSTSDPGLPTKPIDTGKYPSSPLTFDVKGTSPTGIV